MSTITVSVDVNVPIDTVWQMWNNPEDIVNWCSGSEDGHTPAAENDLRAGGKFKTTMAAKDKSASFDFEGTYTEVIKNEKIAYEMADGRKVEIIFEEKDNGTLITETFEPEETHTIQEQRIGWQTILNNFKTYAENTDSAHQLYI